jgi:hypothetical protein
MSDPGSHDRRGPKRKPGAGKKGPNPAGPGKRFGGMGLRPLSGNDFVLRHPNCVGEMELDYEEGIELWRAGEPEDARDALRYALEGCGDNLWVHVALGQIALKEFNDPSLARGHFGYAFELVRQAVPPHFTGRIPRDHPLNWPMYEAIEGLIACHEALKQPRDAEELRRLADTWSDYAGNRPRKQD